MRVWRIHYQFVYPEQQAFIFCLDAHVVLTQLRDGLQQAFCRSRCVRPGQYGRVGMVSTGSTASTVRSACDQYGQYGQVSV